MNPALETVGLELEFFSSATPRHALALAIADALHGTVSCGFKCHAVGGSEGRPIFDMTPASRVCTNEGIWLCSLVDDFTIETASPAGEGKSHRLYCDDARIARWIEKNCWARSNRLEPKIASLSRAFQLKLDRGERFELQDGVSGVLADDRGSAFASIASYEDTRHAACELVTAPLGTDERSEFLATVYAILAEHGVAAAKTGAMHIHFDANIWQEPSLLSALLVMYSERRQSIWDDWKTNRQSTKLGPFPADAVEYSRRVLSGEEAGDDIAGVLLDCGVQKYLDINVLGVLDPFYPQPTLEVRCLPVPATPDAAADSIHKVQSFLTEVVSSTASAP
jgi:hypothetical protein